ncbi:MAG: BfmA/BtgA family mobilization protein, partial [Sphingobacterium sp.]
MNTKDYQVVRLSKLTAQRIKLFNKGNSYDENINAFLDYFDRTGANPWSLKEHPIEITMKGFDRTIA